MNILKQLFGTQKGGQITDAVQALLHRDYKGFLAALPADIQAGLIAWVHAHYMP